MLVPVDSTKPGIISFWPILIKLFCKLFADFKLFTSIPNFLAIEYKLSPLFTTYIELSLTWSYGAPT